MEPRPGLNRGPADWQSGAKYLTFQAVSRLLNSQKWACLGSVVTTDVTKGRQRFCGLITDALMRLDLRVGVAGPKPPAAFLTISVRNRGG
jgi:hypothetical protein